VRWRGKKDWGRWKWVGGGGMVGVYSVKLMTQNCPRGTRISYLPMWLGEV